MVEKVSELVPLCEGQLLNYEEWDEHTSEERKWELYDGVPFSPDGLERDRLAVCLIFSMGLQVMLKILPKESKDILRELLNAKTE
jgi:hypothetical protein